jgi:hypothetical protein
MTAAVSHAVELPSFQTMMASSPLEELSLPKAPEGFVLNRTKPKEGRRACARRLGARAINNGR